MQTVIIKTFKNVQKSAQKNQIESQTIKNM